MYHDAMAWKRFIGPLWKDQLAGLGVNYGISNTIVLEIP